MNIWIFFTILAALMQAIRTAAQKELATDITPLAATLVRYLFGLPFVLTYVFACLYYYDLEIPTLDTFFITLATLAAITQILATIALIKAISYNTFAVGTTLVKTETLQTAWLGVAFFGAHLAIAGWLSILVGLVGAMLISRFNFKNLKFTPGAGFGLLAGLGFAFTSLCLREASLSIQAPAILSAACTLAFMVSLQTLLCLVWVVYRQKDQLRKITQNMGVSVLVGASSAAGSAGWFTAMTLQNPALVKTLGQVEFLFTIALTHLYFKEHINKREYSGMFLIIISVVFILIDRL